MTISKDEFTCESHWKLHQSYIQLGFHAVSFFADDLVEYSNGVKRFLARYCSEGGSRLYLEVRVSPKSQAAAVELFRVE